MPQPQISNKALDAIIQDAGSIDKVLASGAIEAEWLTDAEVAEAWRQASAAIKTLDEARRTIFTAVTQRREA